MKTQPLVYKIKNKKMINNYSTINNNKKRRMKNRNKKI